MALLGYPISIEPQLPNKWSLVNSEVAKQFFQKSTSRFLQVQLIQLCNVQILLAPH